MQPSMRAIAHKSNANANLPRFALVYTAGVQLALCYHHIASRREKWTVILFTKNGEITPNTKPAARVQNRATLINVSLIQIDGF